MNENWEKVNRFAWEMVQLSIQMQQEMEKLQQQLEEDNNV